VAWFGASSADHFASWQCRHLRVNVLYDHRLLMNGLLHLGHGQFTTRLDVISRAIIHATATTKNGQEEPAIFEKRMPTRPAGI
jgi:hypothetical protein